MSMPSANVVMRKEYAKNSFAACVVATASFIVHAYSEEINSMIDVQNEPSKKSEYYISTFHKSTSVYSGFKAHAKPIIPVHMTVEGDSMYTEIQRNTLYEIKPNRTFELPPISVNKSIKVDSEFKDDNVLFEVGSYEIKPKRVFEI